MFTAYVVVSILAAVASTLVAIGNFMRHKFALGNAAKLGVPESWMTMLGILNVAGALGLLLGLIGVPLIGTAAAIGLLVLRRRHHRPPARTRLLIGFSVRVPPAGRGHAGVGTGHVNRPGFDGASSP